jgi:UDP-glucose 4-epimerase
VIQDFVRKLATTPENLDVLGDGTQQKCYLHVDELLDAMLFIHGNAPERLNYFNIGANDAGVTVKFIAEMVVARVAPRASISFGKGNKGWVGDVPKFSYSIAKLSKLGSAQAICKAVDEVADQESRG